MKASCAFRGGSPNNGGAEKPAEIFDNMMNALNIKLQTGNYF